MVHDRLLAPLQGTSGFVTKIAHGRTPVTADLWGALQSAHADDVLSGHDYDWERFAPQNTTGTADASGIRKFVMGTGGANTQQFGLGVAANSGAGESPADPGSSC